LLGHLKQHNSNVSVVLLHATKEGMNIYQKAGFQISNHTNAEMKLIIQ